MPSARILINRDSGGASDPDGILAHALGAFRAAGWDVEGEAVPGAEIGAALGRAVDASPNRLVVGGGDGTIRAAAESAMACGAALGIITLGTMNLLAKDLRLPLDPMEAASALVDAEERLLDVGVVNDVIFLHSSLIGVFPTIAVERERARREGGVLGYAGAALGAMRLVWRAQSVGVDLRIDGRSQRLRTFAVVISNNKMRGDPAEPYRRVRLDAGTLGLYLSRHTGRAGLFRLLMSIGMGRWKFDSDIDEHEAVEVSVNARRALHVSNDGEIQRMAPPLRYTLRPRALRALVPRTPGPGA